MTWTRFVAALLTSLLIATGTLESRAADTSSAETTITWAPVKSVPASVRASASVSR